MLLLVALLVLLLPDVPVLKTRSGRDELPSIPRDEEAALDELATVLSVPCLRGRRAGRCDDVDGVPCLCPRSRLTPSFPRLALATREAGSARSSKVQTTERRKPVEPTITKRTGSQHEAGMSD